MEHIPERLVPEQSGSVELEQKHRYLCAASLALGKDALILADEGGCGSLFLAAHARSVCGVQDAADAAERASDASRRDNVCFVVGRAQALPLPDAACDLVIDFETEGGHRRRESRDSASIAEIRRVLRPGGALLIGYAGRSLPEESRDGSRFGDARTEGDVDREGFENLLRGTFQHVALYRQRIVHGSALLAQVEDTLRFQREDDRGELRSEPGLTEPSYLIAVASDGPPPRLPSGLLEDATVRGAASHVPFPAAVDADAGGGDGDVQDDRVGRRFDVMNATNDAADASTRSDSMKHRLVGGQEDVAKLSREKAVLDETVRRLSADNAALAAAVLAYRNSASWRVSAPLRAFTRIARRCLAPLLWSLRVVRAYGRPAFTPLKDLTVLPDGSFSTGPDPQFAVHPLGGSLRAGWSRLDVEIESDQPTLSATLFAMCDGGHHTAHAVVLGNNRVQRIVALPQGVRHIRFDPTEKAGVRLKVRRLSVASLGRVGLAVIVYRLLPEDERRRFKRALLGGHPGRAAMILRGGLAAAAGDDQYRTWAALYDTPDAADLDVVRALGEALPNRPLISILMPVYNTRPKYLRKALDTVLRQTYSNWELCVADDASTNSEVRSILSEYAARDARIKVVFRETNGHICAASNSALDLVSGEFVALMDHDDALPPHALYMVASEINRRPDVDLIYTDEDKIDAEDRRHDPHFKTDWNRELFYSQNMVAHLGVYRTEIARRIGGFRVGFEGSQDYDFVLRFLPHTRPERIRHIPHVLYHWRIFPGVTSFSTDNPDASVATARRAMVEYFETAEPGSVVEPLGHGWWRIRRPLPTVLPRVSLIVPTRDRLDVLKVAVDGLLNETDYDNLQVIIVDNDSVEPDTLAYFDRLGSDPRVKIVRVSGAFNFSALNNEAVESADGEILGFINNDIEIIDAGWLREMVAQVLRPNVGAVGARLLYANGTVQHAGVIMGLYGVAAHSHRHFARASVGYFGRPVLVQNLSAVTAACMLVPRSVFEAVGGYDADNLTVGYNDVDLCLKIREKGYEIVYTPFAELYHLESVSRGENRTAMQIERDARERAYMMARWPRVIARDPFYNPNLSTETENFALAFPPRVARPWARADEGERA